MKTKLFFASLFALSVQQTVIAQTDALGYTQVDLTMGAQYQNRVFFGFSDKNIVSQPANTWDIAFYRNADKDFGTRVNDAKGILVYQVSKNPNDFDTVDLSKKSTWGDPLYNPDKTDRLQNGAFEASTLLPSTGMNFGWGAYNAINHHVEGKVVFVLELADKTVYKFFIQNYFKSYTFKYAKWNGTSWDATVTKTIDNGSDDAFFNYVNLSTGEKVPNLEPSKSSWDLMFTKYMTFYNNTMMYPLTGAIQNPSITVAKARPETQETATYNLPADAAFSKEITAIGHSWKPTSGIHPDAVYYIKKNNQYYRMYFTKNGGATTGDMFFKYKNITSELGVTDLGKKASFGIYPNPIVNKKATLIFDVKEKINNTGSVEVYDLSGKKVYEATLSNQSGLYKQELNLSKLSTGNYLVKITYGGITETKKVIVK
ncbi:T9SS type A sorting domain-containing protein [Chryseobacterium sp. T1]